MSAQQSIEPSEPFPDNYVPPADKLMLAALRDGTYILAVACRVCGAPLTAQSSKAAGIGPRCRRKPAATVVVSTMVASEGAA